MRGPLIVQRGAVEEVMSRSSILCRCEQRTGFEHLGVIGKTVGDFYEFLRQLHLSNTIGRDAGSHQPFNPFKVDVGLPVKL